MFLLLPKHLYLLLMPSTVMNSASQVENLVVVCPVQPQW